MTDSTLAKGSFCSQAGWTVTGADPPTCYLLNRTPPEIRNQIYELTFEPEAKDVDRLQAQPPANCLLLNCWAIYSEAGLLYLDAYRKFWTSSRFSISIEQDLEQNRAILALLRNDPKHEDVEKVWSQARELKEEDIAQVSPLSIIRKTKDGVHVCRLLENGVWWFVDVLGNGLPNCHRILRVPQDTRSLIGGHLYVVRPSEGFTDWDVSVRWRSPCALGPHVDLMESSSSTSKRWWARRV